MICKGNSAGATTTAHVNNIYYKVQRQQHTEHHGIPSISTYSNSYHHAQAPGSLKRMSKTHVTSRTATSSATIVAIATTPAATAFTVLITNVRNETNPHCTLAVAAAAVMMLLRKLLLGVMLL